MFISKITICNLFAYYGEQSIDFERQDGKNLYCIYGDNGFGKTSFIRCAKLLFLGTGGASEKIPAVIQRFAPKESSYTRFIRGNKNDWRGILNRNALNEGRQEFFVRFNGKLNDDTFCIQRAWENVQETQIKETLFLQIDGQTYENDEAQQRLNGILPPNFVEFFFFDGEEIESISDNLRTKLREKIIEILQISPLEIIIKQAGKLRDELISKEATNQTQQNNLATKQKELEVISEDLQNRQNQLIANQKFLEEKEQKERDIRKSLDKLIADSSKEREQLINEKNNKEQALQKEKKELSETIKSVIFASNASLVEGLKKHIQHINQSTRKDDITSLKKFTPQIQSHIEQALRSLPYQASTIEDFIRICNQILEQMPNILESKMTKEYSKLPIHHIERIKETLILLESISPRKQILNIKSLKAQIAMLKSQQSELNFDEYTQIKQDELTSQLQECERQKKHLQLFRDEFFLKIENLKNTKEMLAKEIYSLEQSINTERIDNKLKMIEYLCACISEYKDKLIELLRQELHDKILEKYKAILPNDNVCELHIGLDFEIKLRDKDGEAIIVESQSSGQKQILAICIFWALSELSNSKIPLIIDTPLSRIDATNRANIVAKYYAQDNQVIILPHSGEIGLKEYQYAKPNLAGLYKIQNSENRSCAHIEPADISEIL
ncbi:hypothetical protein [Helicobacter sp. T3_23-1056]